MRPSAAQTPRSRLLSRHQTATFIMRRAVLLPTLLSWSLVYRTQILEAELAESLGRDMVVRRGEERGLASPDIFERLRQASHRILYL